LAWALTVAGVPPGQRGTPAPFKTSVRIWSRRWASTVSAPKPPQCRPGRTPPSTRAGSVPTIVLPPFFSSFCQRLHRFFIVLPGPGASSRPAPAAPDGHAPHASAVASIRRLPPSGPALSNFSRRRRILYTIRTHNMETDTTAQLLGRGRPARRRARRAGNRLPLAVATGRRGRNARPVIIDPAASHAVLNRS
jgi:hypothetical protein